jgi:predicted dehydrogenase
MQMSNYSFDEMNSEFLINGTKGSIKFKNNKLYCHDEKNKLVYEYEETFDEKFTNLFNKGTVEIAKRLKLSFENNESFEYSTFEDGYYNMKVLTSSKKSFKNKCWVDIE